MRTSCTRIHSAGFRACASMHKPWQNCKDTKKAARKSPYSLMKYTQ